MELLENVFSILNIFDAIVFLIRNSAVSGQLWADAGWHPMAT